ncbi:unnamed protein product [Cylicostephanus goldi]|uniref:Uncharacterized protein n=1 Tax=Cylicostephanus goldi TaxID=71465 RepID=A0A3P7NLQ1_CYLGO|nr:unnamed protein product [Cylicostephanus goldi]
MNYILARPWYERRTGSCMFGVIEFALIDIHKANISRGIRVLMAAPHYIATRTALACFGLDSWRCKVGMGNADGDFAVR